MITHASTIALALARAHTHTDTQYVGQWQTRTHCQGGRWKTKWQARAAVTDKNTARGRWEDEKHMVGGATQRGA